MTIRELIRELEAAEKNVTERYKRPGAETQVEVAVIIERRTGTFVATPRPVDFVDVWCELGDASVPTVRLRAKS